MDVSDFQNVGQSNQIPAKVREEKKKQMYSKLVKKTFRALF